MTSTALKILALVLMLFDHIAYFLPGMPVWFRQIGRLSAPIFMFILVWGLQYTSDRTKYLIRLYLFGVGMAIMNLALSLIIPNMRVPLVNNIFVTLLLVGIIATIFDKISTAKKTGIMWLVAFVLLQVASISICNAIIDMQVDFTSIITALLPNLLFNEGGPLFITLGVLLYYTKNKKISLTIGYLCFCALMFRAAYLSGLHYIPLMSIAGYKLSLSAYLLNADYQWMMVGALPFMLIYNHKKGAGLKYLFYIFYPLHVAVLFLIGNLLF